MEKVVNVELEKVVLEMSLEEARSMMEVLTNNCPMSRVESFIVSCRKQICDQILNAAKEQNPLKINNDNK